MIEFTPTGDPRKDRVLQYIAENLAAYTCGARGRIELNCEEDYDFVTFILSNGASEDFTFDVQWLDQVTLDNASSVANEIHSFIHRLDQTDAQWAARGYYPGVSAEAQ